MLGYPIRYIVTVQRTLNNINPEFIYISHLHNDHFDPKILKRFKNKKQVKILIKKFKFSRLKIKIFDLGFNKNNRNRALKKLELTNFLLLQLYLNSQIIKMILKLKLFMIWTLRY